MSLEIISIKNEIKFFNVNVTGCLVYTSSILEDTSTFTCVPSHVHIADLTLYKHRSYSSFSFPLYVDLWMMSTWKNKINKLFSQVEMYAVYWNQVKAKKVKSIQIEYHINKAWWFPSEIVKISQLILFSLHIRGRGWCYVTA